MSLAAVADDHRHTLLVVDVASLETGRSVEIDSLDRIGGLADRIGRTQFVLIGLPIVAAGRTDDFHLVGRKIWHIAFEQIEHRGDKIDAVNKDVQVVRSFVLQKFGTMLGHLTIGAVRLVGSNLDVREIRPAHLANRQVLEFF